MSTHWTNADALVAFATLPGVGARTLNALEIAFRSFETAAMLPLGECAALLDGVVPGAGTPLREAPLLEDQIVQVRAAARAVGASILCEADPGWPARLVMRSSLKAGSRPPRLLWVRGSLEGLEACHSVGIVGARRADALARKQAKHFGAGLAEAGMTVVSGGAAGVDGQAHLGAISVGGRSLVVMGTAIDKVYPTAHRSLFKGVLDQGGALISEWGPGCETFRAGFSARNRILSALSDAVILVAGNKRSGALITATHAEAQGRLVCAVPGDPRRRLSEASNRLLVEGALAVLEPAHAIAHLLSYGTTRPDDGRLTAYLCNAAPGTGKGALAMGGQLPISKLALRVLGALDDEAKSLDQLALSLELSAASVAAALTELELGGLAQRRQGAYVLSSLSFESSAGL